MFGSLTVAILKNMQALKGNFEAVQTNAETTNNPIGQSSPNLAALWAEVGVSANKTIKNINGRLDIIEQCMKRETSNT